ncbi:flagellar assembly protein FliX [uncultured Kiloniella sp.]|uniref:flagellar assembly protein FliX n=1 Tax=uncultured Kiloniella sp. TaxID=1133091 RepID=UPI00263192F5|nr:flagellar assembly protein FliX [uncultured Kiloniella sp.]
MKIRTGSSVTPAAGSKSKRKASGVGGSFSDALESGAGDSVSDTGGVSAAGGVSGLLSIQEVPDALTGKQKAKKQAEDILDELEELRLGLLFGSIPVWRLEKIESLVAQRREQINDPRLLEILNEVEVRAAVELAKLGR